MSEMMIGWRSRVSTTNEAVDRVLRWASAAQGPWEESFHFVVREADDRGGCLQVVTVQHCRSLSGEPRDAIDLLRRVARFYSTTAVAAVYVDCDAEGALYARVELDEFQVKHFEAVAAVPGKSLVFSPSGPFRRLTEADYPLLHGNFEQAVTLGLWDAFPW